MATSRVVACLFAVWALASGPGAGEVCAQAPPKQPAKGGWESETPTGELLSRTLVSGKKRLSCHGLSRDEPLTVKATGPATLVVYSVLELAAGSTEEQGYTMLASIDKKAPTKLTEKSSPSKTETFLTGGDKSVPGALKKSTITVPEGDHTYALLADPACVRTVYVRLFVQPKFSSANKTVYVDIKSKKYRYFTLAADAPIQITVTGPMELRLTTRLDFAKDSMERRKYEVSATMDGGAATRKSFNVGRSKTAKYVKADSGAVPGAVGSKVYDVPAGKHTFVFTLAKGSKDIVNVRIAARKK